MKKLLEHGGVIAGVMLVALGAGSMVVGMNGRSQVRHDLAREQIVGTPDMAGVANQKIDTGSKARQFAAGMRKHALEATGGQTYAQMPRFMGKDGKPTSDEKQAAIDPKSGKPVDNPARNIWVTETALTTALNTSFFAESVAKFAITMGFALLLVGIGFLVVTFRLLKRQPKEEAAKKAEPRAEVALAH